MGAKSRRSARLSAVRARIDRLDEQLLRLINQRAQLALVIGRIKKRRKWPVFDARREAIVLRRVRAANAGPLTARAVRHVFQAILSECRRRESRRPSRGPRAPRGVATGVPKPTVGFGWRERRQKRTR